MIAIFNGKLCKVKTSGSRFSIVKMASDVVKHIVSVQSNNESLGLAIGSGRYTEGSTIQIEAVPNVGCKFLRWSDGSTDAQREIIVDGDISLVAYFEIDQTRGILEYVPNKDVYIPTPDNPAN